MMKTANDRPLVIHAGGHRQHIGQENAGDARTSNAELAAKLDGRIGLGVPHVDMTGPAAHPQNDDGGRRRRLAECTCLILGTQQLTERQPRRTQNTGLHEAATTQNRALRYSAAPLACCLYRLRHGSAPILVSQAYFFESSRPWLFHVAAGRDNRLAGCRGPGSRPDWDADL